MALKSTMMCISNVAIRQLVFENMGDVMEGHKHPHNHGTLLGSGAIELEVDGIKTVFKAPSLIFIDKDKYHNMTALESNTTVYCIHAVRIGDGIEDIIPEEAIPDGVEIKPFAFPLEKL